MDLKDLNTRKRENRATCREVFHLSCRGISIPCTTSTNLLICVLGWCVVAVDYYKSLSGFAHMQTVQFALNL